MGARGNRGGGRPKGPANVRALKAKRRRPAPDAPTEPVVRRKGSGGGTGIPPPPDDASDAVRREWARLGEALADQLHTAKDRDAFRDLVHAIVLGEEMWAKIEKDGPEATSIVGKGRVVKCMSVPMRVWTEALNKKMGLYARFGMTPADRARMDPDGDANAAPAEEPEDEFGNTGT